MKKIPLVITAVVFLTAAICIPSLAEYKPAKIFSLSDGTTVKGSIVGIRPSDNAYLIETETMGTVAIHPDNVRSMANPGSASNNDEPSGTPQAGLQDGLSPSMIQNAQKTLLSDPAIAESIQGLMSDPEIMQLLQDPQVMQAIMSMDPQVIQSNPKIQALLENPAMQKIIAQSAQKLMQPDPR